MPNSLTQQLVRELYKRIKDKGTKNKEAIRLTELFLELRGKRAGAVPPVPEVPALAVVGTPKKPSSLD